MAEYGAIDVLTEILYPGNSISDSDLIVILEGLDRFLSVYGGKDSHNPFAEQFEEFKGLDYLEERQCDENISEEAFDAIVDLLKKYWGIL